MISAEELKQAINEVAATEEGRVFLAYLKHYCGFDHNIIHPDNPHMTYHSVAIRGVYGHIRKNIRRDHLIKIEHNYEFGNEPKKEE